MDLIFGNMAYTHTPDSAGADKLEMDKKPIKSKTFLVLLILLGICLVVSIASLIFTFVLFHHSQNSMNEKFSEIQDVIEGSLAKFPVDNSSRNASEERVVETESTTAELPSTIQVDNRSQNALEERLAAMELAVEELSTRVEADEAELMRLKTNNMDLVVTLNETQLLIHILSEEVISYHQAEDEISCTSDYTRNPFANSCIRLMPAAKNWTSAKNDCESSGERLATFETLESQYWFISLRKTTSWRTFRVWVGAEKFSTGEWIWDGEIPRPITGVLWGGNNPNNDAGDEDCMDSAKGIDYRFNDASCSSVFAYICERLT